MFNAHVDTNHIDGAGFNANVPCKACVATHCRLYLTFSHCVQNTGNKHIVSQEIDTVRFFCSSWVFKIKCVSEKIQNSGFHQTTNG